MPYDFTSPPDDRSPDGSLKWRAMAARNPDVGRGVVPFSVADMELPTPPELVADISANGLLLTGGGALLKGLDLLLHKSTGLSIRIDGDPLTTVVRGTGKTLEDRSFYANVYIN